MKTQESLDTYNEMRRWFVDDTKHIIYVAVYENRVIWFGSWESRTSSNPGVEKMIWKIADIHTLYIDDKRQWKWIWTRLFELLKNVFKKQWYHKIVVWVLQ